MAQTIRCWSLTGLLVSVMLLHLGTLRAESIRVRHTEGTFHGFLVLRTLEGKELAAGDLLQVTKGGRVVSHLVFHFKDGSLDDETTVFTQHLGFRLVSNHHVQKGPAFPHPMDVMIDASTGQITVRKKKIENHHLDLPLDLANGLIVTILKNIRPDAKEVKVSFVATAPKLRLVKLAITPQGEDPFSVAGAPRTATHYVIKVELGGVTGVVAPLIGKQPSPIEVWILGGEVPAFVRMEGQLFEGGPLWRIELTSPVWTGSKSSH